MTNCGYGCMGRMSTHLLSELTSETTTVSQLREMGSWGHMLGRREASVSSLLSMRPCCITRICIATLRQAMPMHSCDEPLLMLLTSRVVHHRAPHSCISPPELSSMPQAIEVITGQQDHSARVAGAGGADPPVSCRAESASPHHIAAPCTPAASGSLHAVRQTSD